MQCLKVYTRAVTPAACLGAALLLAAAGCRHAPDDAALSQNVNGQLASDSSLTGQPVQASVEDRIVTLNGSVENDAQKTIAARDAAGVQGVKEVRNNIAVEQAGPATPTVSVTQTPPQPIAAAAASKGKEPLNPREDRHHAAPIERENPPSTAISAQTDNPPAAQAGNAPPPMVPPAPAAPPPPPPPLPAFKKIEVATGTTIPVRVTQTLDSATTQQGTSFSGVVASDILIDGVVAIPAGTPVSGNVDVVQEAAHYKGSALLTVSLSSITRRGEHIAVTTDPYTVNGKGRGSNTAEKVGGGAAVGAILGGIFGGGKGAAIGAAAGGGVGAGANTVTRGQQVQIPSETVVRFHLSSPFSLRVRSDGEKITTWTGCSSIQADNPPGGCGRERRLHDVAPPPTPPSYAAGRACLRVS